MRVGSWLLTIGAGLVLLCYAVGRSFASRVKANEYVTFSANSREDALREARHCGAVHVDWGFDPHHAVATLSPVNSLGARRCAAGYEARKGIIELPVFLYVVLAKGFV